MSLEASVAAADTTSRDRRANAIAFAVMVALIVIAPFVAYPFFIMQALCFALFACAFNLLLGYANLLSLGHAMFLGLAAMSAPTPRKCGDWSRFPRSRSASPHPQCSASSPGRSPSAASASISP